MCVHARVCVFNPLLLLAENWQKAIGGLPDSTCVYVGNLKFLTREEQIYQLFSRAGVVKRVIMGLNKLTMTPCGFCFVEYYNHEDAVKASKYLVGANLENQVIKVDLDPGFEEGRQYGKSRRTGGQIRDDFRNRIDPSRLPAHQPVFQPPTAAHPHPDRRRRIRSHSERDRQSRRQDSPSHKRARYGSRDDRDRSENPRFRREQASDEEED